MTYNAKHVMSGTRGAIWINEEQVAECVKFQAKVTANKKDIVMNNEIWTGQKVMSYTGKGSLTLNKVTSRMQKLLQEGFQNGTDPLFTIISKLDDPDAFGAERVAIYNVSFDELILADWEGDAPGKTEHPFTFQGFKFLDLVEEK